MCFYNLISVVCFLSSMVTVREPGFNPKEAVRQFCTRNLIPQSVSSQVSSDDFTLDLSNPSLENGEFLIDTNIIWVPATNRQYVPATAFDGTNFLVVWSDERNGYADIYGARVSQSGIVLDYGGIAISTASGNQWYAAVAFDGVNFLVVWGTPGAGVFGSRVTLEGVVLDPGGISISTLGGGIPALAFDGDNYLVVWKDPRTGNYDIFGARVTPAGIVLEASGIPISTEAYGQHDPSLAFDGENYLVVWTDERNGYYDIYGCRMTPAGVVLDTTGFPISTAMDGQGFSATAFDGTNYLVVWHDGRNGPNLDIYGCRVSPNGIVLDSSGIVVSTAGGNQSTPAVAFDGANFLVVWEDDWNWNISGARVSPDGQVLDTSSIVISTEIYWELHPAVTSDGNRCLVSWGDFLDSWGEVSDLVGTRVTQDGVVLEPGGIVISTAANWQREAAVAFDGSNYLVAWSDWCGGELDSDIYASRVSPTGAVLDSLSFVVSTAVRCRHPVATFDGTNYLVVWEEWIATARLRGVRVNPTGQVLDTLGIVISTQLAQYNPAVAFDGSNYFVVWTGSTEPGINGARVSPDGQVLDTLSFVLWNGRCDVEEPAIAFDGTNYFVVCTDWREARDPEIYGARVSPSGVVLDPEGIRISDATGNPWDPSVAFDGSNFLVVWCDWRSGDSADIYGARVTPAGVVLDTASIAISTATNDQLCPTIAFDGSDFLVVWDDYRNSLETSHIYGTRVKPDGTVFGEGQVVSQEGKQSNPTLVRGSGSQLFLTYQGWAGIVGNKTYNTDRIWGKMNPSTVIVEMPKPEIRMTNKGSTIVRGVINLQSAIFNLRSKIALFDITGRKVADLKSGANNIHNLAPGVYFLRSDNNNQVTKFIITK